MYSLVFITKRRVSFCSVMLLAHQLLACSESGKCHSLLSESLEQAHQLFFSFSSRTDSGREFPPPPKVFTTHPFPADEQDTVGSTFPAPPDPTGKVLSPLAPSPSPHSSLPSQLDHRSNLLAINALSSNKKLYISSLRSKVSPNFCWVICALLGVLCN